MLCSFSLLDRDWSGYCLVHFDADHRGGGRANVIRGFSVQKATVPINNVLISPAVRAVGSGATVLNRARTLMLPDVTAHAMKVKTANEHVSN